MPPIMVRPGDKNRAKRRAKSDLSKVWLLRRVVTCALCPRLSTWQRVTQRRPDKVGATGRTLSEPAASFAASRKRASSGHDLLAVRRKCHQIFVQLCSSVRFFASHFVTRHLFSYISPDRSSFLTSLWCATSPSRLRPSGPSSIFLPP